MGSASILLRFQRSKVVEIKKSMGQTMVPRSYARSLPFGGAGANKEEERDHGYIVKDCKMDTKISILEFFKKIY